jgi:TetR/AcrR family transcriptional regulator, regulator of cefoperazone and chloramphenicol sensitivity
MEKGARCREEKTMYKPLEKARKDPDSMKGRVLAAARKLFGAYGYHGATTRMIAKEVGIDISTLYYHWGEKKDLFEAVIVDVKDSWRAMVQDLGARTMGKPLYERYAIAIDSLCDFLIMHPEVPNLILFQHFGKTKQEFDEDLRSPVTLNEVASAMGFALEDREFSNKVKAGILAVWFSIFSFVAGKKDIKAIFEMDDAQYAQMIKDTMKRILIPDFGRKKKTARAMEK